MAKTLKIWNGRSGCCYKRTDPAWSGADQYKAGTVYAAAYSRADLRRLIADYCGSDPGDHEIKTYWNDGHWGDVMEGIAPERGLWLLKHASEKIPVRLT